MGVPLYTNFDMSWPANVFNNATAVLGGLTELDLDAWTLNPHLAKSWDVRAGRRQVLHRCGIAVGRAVPQGLW